MPEARIVLDTNVVLDWLVFRDPGVAHIARALMAQTLVALTNDACEKELIRVLSYAAFNLDAPARRAALEDYRRTAVHYAGTADGTPLPRCSDPDDQKFLELARDGQARFLITKDKALLRLARSRNRVRAFGIVTPSGFSISPLRAPAPGARR